LNVTTSVAAVEIRDVAELRDIIVDANAGGTTMSVRGGGSKAAIGGPREASTDIMLSRLGGIIDYDPAELVLTAGAGTNLAEIESLIAQNNQMLGFEPMDYGPLFGTNEGSATIGGTIAASCSGPRRFAGGAARDHFIGFEAISGRGDMFKGGGKVVKNVTGYDLPKLLAGSWGSLAVLTRVTVRVVPRPRAVATLVMAGLSDREAVEIMSRAVGSTTAITGAAHLPAPRAAALPAAPAGGRALTLLRVEAATSSLAPHTNALAKKIAPHSVFAELDESQSQNLWSYLRDVRSFAADTRPLWRISVAPTEGPSVTEALTPYGAEYVYDWAGGLIWLVMPESADAGAERVRAAAIQARGYATLIRAGAEVRAAVPAFAPEPAALAHLSQRVKTAFDPRGVLNPGRFIGAGTF
jgi:glycolate oxidase FAD binding subunit